VWGDGVAPAAVTPRRLTAHLALLALSQPDEAAELALGAPVQLAGHLVAVRERRVERRGRLALATGRVVVTATATGRVDELVAAGLHLGGMDFHGITARDPGGDRYAAAAAALWDAFPIEPMPRLLQRVQEFAGPDGRAQEFDLDAALPTGRQQIVESVFSELTARFSEQYRRLYHDHRRILEMLVAAGYDLPRPLRAAAELTLDAEVEAELSAAVAALGTDSDPQAFASLVATARLAREQGYELHLDAIIEALSDCIASATGVAARSLTEADAVTLERWLDLADELEVELDLSRPQELVWGATTRCRAGRLGASETAIVARLGERLGLAPSAWSI
jgi:hypothetical protein